MKEVAIPRYVDSLVQFLFWEWDEFCLAVLLFGMGIVFEQLTIAILLIYPVSVLFRRSKVGALEGLLMHKCFWWGLMPLNKETQDSMIRSRHA